MKLRQIQLRQLALLQHLERRHKLRRMPQVLRPVQHHPRNRDPDEQRDIDRLAEPAARALVLNRIQQMNQLVLIHLAVPARADAHRLP